MCFLGTGQALVIQGKHCLSELLNESTWSQASFPADMNYYCLVLKLIFIMSVVRFNIH